MHESSNKTDYSTAEDQPRRVNLGANQQRRCEQSQDGRERIDDTAPRQLPDRYLHQAESGGIRPIQKGRRPWRPQARHNQIDRRRKDERG